MKTLLRFWFAAAFLLGIATTVFPQLNGNRAGKLDLGFADNGTAIYGRTTFFDDSLMLDDGSIFQLSTTTASFPSNRIAVELRKFTHSGAPDPNFGTNGRRIYDFGFDAGGVAISRLNDGKYLIAGSANPSGQFGESDFLIFRINSNGDIDTSFGNNGIVLKNFPSPDTSVKTGDGADSIHQRPGGKLLISGTSTRFFESQSQNQPSSSALIMLNADGTVDASYGNNGMVEQVVGTDGYLSVGVLNSVSAIYGDGRLLQAVIPEVTGGNPPFQCKLVRFLPNGSLDNSFGVNGIKELMPGQMSSCRDFALLPSGRILVLTGWSLIRLNEDGSTDAVFADGGTLSFGQGKDFADLLVTENGKIYVAGKTQVFLETGYTEHALIQAFHSNGLPDLRFGNSGTASLLVTGGSPTAFRRMHISQNNTLLLSGAYNFPPSNLLLSRFTFAR